MARLATRLALVAAAALGVQGAGLAAPLLQEQEPDPRGLGYAGGGGEHTAPQGDDTDFRETRIFRLPETRDARSLAESAEDHIRAGRWSQAIDDLQELLEEHPGDVLPKSWHPKADETFLPAHPGAAEWARVRLTRLEGDVRALYRERHDAASRQALALARANADRRALAEIAQRWPITDAAESAWWALGDLELELGHVDDAVIAWERAVDVLGVVGGDMPAGAAVRLELVRRIQSGELTLAGRVAGPQHTAELRLPGPGEGSGPPPKDSASTWQQDVDAPAFSSRIGDDYNLFPILAGDRILLSTSLSLLAFDAYTGEPVWDSGEPAGWSALSIDKREELYSGIDRTWAMVAPAAGEGVAVAALQIPLAKDSAKDYQGITIKVPIPERRLFAFDLEDGTPLWSHAPTRAAFELGGTSYAERMLVAGPPVVSGTRVLVPCCRIEGRIEYHVACYDLPTGALLWSTELISGQRELNMFGRHESEFCSAPLRVEGDRVIAVTQLGLVAAVDLFSGRILWESLYEQTPLPSSRTYSPRRRSPEWRNAPPVVSGDVVIATPIDSPDMVAFDLADGTVLWSLSRDRLLPFASGPGINVLLGADESRVYVGGGTIAALSKPGGLRSRGAFVHDWTFELDEDSRREINWRPRSVLGGEHVVVPERAERQVLSRQSGQLVGRQPWTLGQVGNLVLGDGMLFSLSSERLSGFFDWKVLEKRSRERMRLAPDSPEAVLPLAQLLLRRGVTLHEAGSTAEALGALREARTVLEPLLGRVPGDGDVRALDEPTDPRVARVLHQVLREEARSVAGLADRSGALSLLARAEELAPDATALRDTLLQREALLQHQPDPGPWLDTLAELERECGSLELPTEHLLSSTTDPALLPRSAPGGEPLTVALWVLLLRSDHWRDVGSGEAELEELHTCLARYPDRVLPSGTRVSDYASERIGEHLDLFGRSDYAPFEARAKLMLDRALAAGPGEDDRALEDLVRLYPHSRAAEESRRLRLERAFESADSGVVARMVQESLSGRAQPTREDAALLLLLADVLGREGNVELKQSLLRRVAAAWPQLELEGGGRLQDVVAALPEVDAAAGFQRVTFDSTVEPTTDESEVYELLGELPQVPGRGAAEPAKLILWSTAGISALSADDPSKFCWRSDVRIPAEWKNLWTLFADRVLLLTDENKRLTALDGTTGKTSWSWEVDEPGAEDLIYVTGSDGVALVMIKRVRVNAYRIVAFDAHAGVELWRYELPTGMQWLSPICGAGRVVFLPPMHSGPAQGVALDLFRGCATSVVEPRERIYPSTHRGAWIEGDLLLLPGFLRAGKVENHVLAIDLDTGRERWRRPFDELIQDGELYGIARYAGSTYLILASGDGGGAIVELVPGSESTRRLYDLDPGEEVVGIKRGGLVDLEAPYLFLRTSISGARTTPITAVHLPGGYRWSHQLPVSYEELYDSGMPMPAVSDTTVAVAYATSSRRSTGVENRHLVFLDRESGRPLDSRILPPVLGRAQTFKMSALGHALLFLSKGTMPPRLEVWEPRR